jgi:DNA-binding NarL/FixJ family response regulator
MSIRVLLVDDNPAFLETEARFLSADPRVHVVGGVLSGVEALEQVGLLRPDLVLIDLAMTGMNGLETTRHLKALEPPPLVIILTLHDNLEYRIAAELAQADGFVAKADFGAKLLPLIHHLFPDQKANTTALQDKPGPTRGKEVLL